MSKVKRTNQSGSTIVFVIVGIILTIGLISVVYFVNQRGEVARNEQVIAAYDKAQADKKAAEESNKAEEVNTGDVKNQDSNATTSNSASELPVTGPEYVFGELLGSGLIVAATVGYLSSRRNLLRYL